ncbi:MAG: response regulator transcription factor [Chloroflexi bacterium]|nr:response regulator transcription factor [Chloroflexota bacterium]MCI0577361.1 response regulator transcription factor [Chloroflexota bacterium]MCI0647048.1 response regulator transcription factor [Chloroflexota bacterium]MCI0731071.1 response regulator transcription factor [Chloroflexota bacterium]
MKKIKVLVAEDHHVVRSAIAVLLNREPDIEVVGDVADGRHLLEEVERLQPDVVLMDAQMPHHQPVEATRALRAQCPNVHIVVLSAYRLEEYVVGLLKAGAAGYLLKEDPPSMLIQAIQAVDQGQEWISPRVAGILVDSVRSKDNVLARLTDRETEVLQLMAHGRTNPQIAEDLVISEHTVKNHVTSIFRKLGVETRVEAVLYAISSSLVSAEEIKHELDLSAQA